MKKMSRIFIFAACLFSFFGAGAQTAEDLYNEGVRLKNNNKSDEALVKFQKAVALKPDYTAALYEVGWCSNDQKKYTEALVALRKARREWGTIPKVHFELGYAMEKLGMNDSAMVCYDKCLEYKPDYKSVFRRKGEIYYSKEDYVKGLEMFGKYESLMTDPITDYLFWYRKGFMNNAQKNYSSAKSDLEKSVALKDDYLNTYLELGFACNKLKQSDEAISYFKKAMATDPSSYIPYNGIAEVYRDNIKDIAQAKSWYQKSLAIKSEERKALFGMGYCLNSEGKYDDAKGYLQRAVAAENTYTAAYVELGYSHYMLGNNEEALRNFSKALTLNSQNENARYYSGLVYISQKNKAKAQQMADELKALSSKNAEKLQQKVNAL